MRNSRTNVARTTTPTASGASSTSEAVKSSSEAACPVTQVSRADVERAQVVGDGQRLRGGGVVALHVHVDDGEVARAPAAGGPARRRRCSPACSARSATTASSVEPSTTVTSPADSAGKSSPRVSNSSRCGWPSGSSSTPDERRVRPRAGTVRATRTAATDSATSHGRRWVQPARAEKKPVAGGTSPKAAVSRRSPGTRRSEPGRSSRTPPRASSAGTRVRATSSATTTTLRPAAPTARRMDASNSSRPDRLSATVMPENITVRPAVDIVRRRASVRCSRSLCRWRRPGTWSLGRQVVQRAPGLLAVAGHDEQPVVDRQAEPQHGEDADHRGVDVDEVGEAEQAGQRARPPRRRRRRWGCRRRGTRRRRTP